MSAEETRYTLHQVRQMGWLAPGVAGRVIDALGLYTTPGQHDGSRAREVLDEVRRYQAGVLNDWREDNGGEREYVFFHSGGPLTISESDLVAFYGDHLDNRYEGIVTVRDYDGRYLGCMGRESWERLLTETSNQDRDPATSEPEAS